MRSQRITVAIAVLSVVGSARGDDWTHWRGNMRNGVSAESSGWDGARWIDRQPTWRAQVGDGASSPLVIDSRVFTFGYSDEKNIVNCWNAESGKNVWSVAYPAAAYGRHATGDEGLYSGPSSTPEFDPTTDLLYTLSADGDLHCWNTVRRGEQVWKRNLYDDYRMPQRAKVGRSARRDYRYTSSPLIHGEWLLVEVGGPTGTIVAFDKVTGREIWRSAATDVAGHTAGMAPMVVEGVPCVAVMTFAGLLVVRLDASHAGESAATYPWVTDFANNVAGVAVQDDCCLITSAYNHQSMCKLRITLAGAERLWEQPVASKAATPVIHEGTVYVAWNQLLALDWATGEVLWEGPSIGDAGSCVVTSDRKLIVWAGRGELFLADLAPKKASKYLELARISQLANSDVWPHIAVANQHLFCRDRQGTLLNFSIGKGVQTKPEN